MLGGKEVSTNPDRNPIGRKDFLRLSACLAGLLFLRRDSAQLIPGEKERQAQTREIINEIWQKYQVEVLTVDDKNLDPSTSNNLPSNAKALSEKIHPFNWPAPELAQVIKETLDKIPAVGELIDAIFISLQEDPGVNFHPETPSFATNGTYLWDNWFSSKIGRQVANERKAIAVWISDRIPLDRINTQDVYEYGNYEYGYDRRVALKEKFSTTLIHEIGHAFEFAIREVHYENFTQECPYPEQGGDHEIGEWRSSFQKSHPLYSTFSQVVTLDDRFAFKRGIENQEDLAIDFFQELFIDYFAASFIQPGLLTPQERRYFENIHAGLKENGIVFAKQIVEEPEILLHGLQGNSLLSGFILVDSNMESSARHIH
jgi:hypothetical protein